MADHPLVGHKVYYIDCKYKHTGLHVNVKALKVRRVHNNLVNGAIPTACCFKRPSDAVLKLEEGVKALKEDVTIEIMEVLHE